MPIFVLSTIKIDITIDLFYVITDESRKRMARRKTLRKGERGVVGIFSQHDSDVGFAEPTRQLATSC